MKFIRPAVLALAVIASSAMAAEDIYRSLMPDGSIRYGESPDPKAKSFKKVAPPPPATGVTVVTPEEKSRQFPPVQQGGTTVIPQPPRTPGLQQGAPSGTLQANPSDLPKRSY